MTYNHLTEELIDLSSKTIFWTSLLVKCINVKMWTKFDILGDVYNLAYMVNYVRPLCLDVPVN